MRKSHLESAWAKATLPIATALFTFALAGCGAAPATAPTQEHSENAKAAFLLEQGRAFAEAGDSLRAQQYFAGALKAGADENVVMPLLLRACIAQRNYRLAAEYADAALARKPKNARLRLLSGTLHGSLGDTSRSRERLERAAKELADEPEAQFAVAISFRDDAADVIAADKYFRRYLALAPNGAHAEEARSSLMEQMP
jgi:tetratricopeptide (TPR) repeat protein